MTTEKTLWNTLTEAAWRGEWDRRRGCIRIRVEGVKRVGYIGPAGTRRLPGEKMTPERS